MEKKEIIKHLMHAINPQFRNDWDLVLWYFNYYFKFEISKEDWENWKKENQQ